MKYRRFGRTNWLISEVGYGMWGLAGWSGSNETEYNKALDLSIELGCNFFDSAWGYGEGLSEKVLGDLMKRHSDKKIYGATKIPPMNWKWPSKPEYKLTDCYPYAHIIEYTEKSLKNLKVECIDLQQFHVWEDNWSNQDEWKKAVEKLIQDGKVQHFGISVNRWEPNNCLLTMETGLISSIQAIYNIFDQAPEDKLLPLCKKLDIGFIARVPFDEGSLTGTLTKETVFPPDDWRSTYFVPENLNATVDHVEKLKSVLPSSMSLPEMALRFILENLEVGTMIPGMRSIKNVKANMSVSDVRKLDLLLSKELKNHRWDRTPTSWSQ